VLLLMLLVFAAIVIGGVWLVVGRPRRADAARGPTTAAPEQILAERLARGEIDAAEYRERLSALREPPPGA
jgi:putative membrane protein